MSRNSTMIAKVGIEIEMERGETLARHLWTYDKQSSMADNIKKIVLHHNSDQVEPLPANGRYALKVIPDAKHPSLIEHFITESSVERDIQDGISIRLVPSVADTIRRLFDIKMDEGILLHLSTDIVFVQGIVDTNRQDVLIKYIQNGTLSDIGESGALNILFHMLKNGYIRNLDDEFMVRVVNIAQAGQSTAEFALSLLIHVLRSTRDGLSSNKSVILENLQLSLIMGHFKNIIIKNHETLYLRLFSLINSLISCAKGERRKNILKELNSPENHQLFYKFLKTHTNMTNIIAREVFVLQARLITSTYLQFYTNRGTVTASIFEEPNRNSNASEYDYLDTSNRNTVLGDGVWVSNLQKAESMCSILSLSSMNSKSPGSQLLHKCLEYGKKHYCTYFDSLEKSDYSCDAELYTISQNIISILTNLLCIGIPVHAHNYYLPMFFASREIAISSGMHTVEFFEELFVKTLMLLFHTKAEMRVKTPDDFKKLYQVLKIQLKLVFEKHPKDFEACDMHFSLVNYTTVQEILQKERDERWSNIYTKNPAVQELIQHFNDENLELVTLSRYNTLEKGFVFKNMTTKSGKYFSLKLTSDFQSLLYMDCARNGTEIGNGSRMCIPVSTIKYLVLAEKCNLRTSNLVPASQVKNVFTILYNLMDSYETDSIDCYFYSEDASKTPAESQKEMEELCNVWKDGLNLLLGKEYSQQMQNELNELNEFDCKMQLIELQDIEIPMGPAPPLPVFEYGAF